MMTAEGAARQVAYDFLNEMLSVKWQGRFIQTSGNNGILPLDVAKSAGVTDAVLAKTNLKDAGDAAFWKTMVYFQNPESVDRRLEMWNAFKAGTL
jgi:spermidine/putrescine transport system substrate-binding protein